MTHRASTQPMITAEEVAPEPHQERLDSAIAEFEQLLFGAHEVETAAGAIAVSFARTLEAMKHVRAYALDQRERAAVADANAEKLQKRLDAELAKHDKAPDVRTKQVKGA